MNDTNGKTRAEGLRLAQFGAGYWGPNLIRNFLQIDAVESFTVCDPSEDRLEQMRKRFPGVKTCADPEAVLADPSIDAVVVAIPAAGHYDLAKRALLAGKHVLVEKPLAMTTEHAGELVRLAEERNLTLMVGHTFLFNSVVLKIKEYIDSGLLGDIYYISCQRLNLGMVRSDVNAMWNLAPHDVSIILYWLGEDASSVSCHGLTFLQDGIEDVVFMNLGFDSGRAAHIHVSWLDPNKTRQIVIVGSKKMLIYDDVSPDAKITIFDKGVDVKSIPRTLPEFETFGQFQFMNRVGDVLIPKVGFKEPLSLETRHFVDCILTGQKPLTDGRNGLAVVDVLERAQSCLSPRPARPRQ